MFCCLDWFTVVSSSFSPDISSRDQPFDSGTRKVSTIPRKLITPRIISIFLTPIPLATYKNPKAPTIALALLDQLPRFRVQVEWSRAGISLQELLRWWRIGAEASKKECEGVHGDIPDPVVGKGLVVGQCEPLTWYSAAECHQGLDPADAVYLLNCVLLSLGIYSMAQNMSFNSGCRTRCQVCKLKAADGINAAIPPTGVPNPCIVKTTAIKAPRVFLFSPSRSSLLTTAMMPLGPLPLWFLQRYSLPGSSPPATESQLWRARPGLLREPSGSLSVAVSIGAKKTQIIVGVINFLGMVFTFLMQRVDPRGDLRRERG
ncbi:hypothetical protein CRG98_014394 [Punica granatum]|uniref:Uncharacterized protein n=1 Tax=Punica granatum TaxID=22663 RepID=A0A2I0K9M3_PUNGR|nr:hypothetical protein CRG98_014394 [Punica granatum]